MRSVLRDTRDGIFCVPSKQRGLTSLPVKQTYLSEAHKDAFVNERALFSKE